MEPASLQVLGRKQKEGHRVWTLGPARECPGAADLGQMKRECSRCSPCVDGHRQPHGSASAGTGHRGARQQHSNQRQPLETSFFLLHF